MDIIKQAGIIVAEFIKETRSCPECKTPLQKYIVDRSNPIVDLSVCEECGYELKSEEAEKFYLKLIDETVKKLMKILKIDNTTAKQLFGMVYQNYEKTKGNRK